MDAKMQTQGEDVLIELLVPLKERDINLKTHRGFNKILSSIKAIGLIEPLCVYKENGKYIILDGFLRFKACQLLDVKTIPCMCYRDKEAYTFNRMVNKLSASQESRMLRNSLRTLDEKTVASVFGIKSLKNRLGMNILPELHPKVLKVLDKELMSRHCATELTYVSQERQLEILSEMDKSNDYSISLCRAMIIKTPSHHRNSHKVHKRAWRPESQKKQELVSKLEAIGKRYDFYTTLYRQYSTDLLRLSVYVRKLITNEQIRSHIANTTPEILERFESIVFETQGKQAV
jgi:ParB family transcriptional regulator, chromosome partitioning protein